MDVSLDDILNINHALEELPLAYKYDIINYHKIKTPELIKHIDTHGILFYKKEMTAKNWKTYRLGDIVEINPKVSLKQGYRYSFVEMKDLDATLKYVTPSTIRELKSGSKFQNNDTLFARITPCLENGKICQVKNLANNQGFGSTEFLVFRGKENITDTDFVYYLTRTDYVKNSAVQMMTGTSGRQRVEKSAVAELEISIPDLPTQQRIAYILSSFDDKIELNLQMNQTLENMAQTLFQEMCVPKGKELPEGWRKGKLGEIYKTTSGGTPSRSHNEYFENGTIDWVKSKELGVFFILDTEEKITDDALNNSSAKLLPENSILIAMYGATVGEISILGKSATCNQAICVILPNKEYPFSFVYEYLKSKKDFLKNIAIGGAAQQNISQVVIQNMEIKIPPVRLFSKFHTFAKVIYSKIKSNQQENQTLTQLRDSLLPKLMKGEIEI
jgi:type I restriction enzyme S subunit